ncbi:hypothetical protein ADINL_0802 [Nitrincola lacisaponensis]|uniref:Uncharacterized protein n=1 Tax=Nitrincola lacisaponensis TaxID=267850 RepID=A0A063Y4Y5_9GAMM|nr:hypothetical protein ADINL_0802 [Nitrincola lacisaponensis]
MHLVGSIWVLLHRNGAFGIQRRLRTCTVMRVIALYLA